MFTKRAAVLLFCAALAGCATPPEESVVVRDLSREALPFVNAFRAEHGLPPLVIDGGVAAAAERQARAMAAKGHLSHDVAGNLDRRLTAAGYGKSAASENVGAGDATAEGAIERWKRSSGHRSNMLMREVTRMGMVRAETPGTRYKAYWALVMVGP